MLHKLKSIDLKAVTIIVLVGVIYFALILSKYYALGYYDWDLAFFTQAAWQLVHGKQFVSLVGINYFGDHSYFITLLYLPLFYFFQSPVTLLVIKVFAMLSAGYFLYRFAQPRLGQTNALWVIFLYFFFPANLFALIYEFNPECLAPVFIFLMYIAIDRRRYGIFMVQALLLMMVKENMCLVVAVLSFIVSLKEQRENKKHLRLFSVMSLFVFAVFVLWLVPYFRHLPHHAFTVRYAHAHLFGHHNIAYIIDLFNVFLFPSLLAPGALLPMLPLLLQHLLSNHPPEHTIFFHYGPSMAAFIFVAFIVFLSRYKENPVFSRSVIILSSAAVLLSFISYKDAFLARWHIGRLTQAQERWDLLQRIPDHAAVVASFEFQAPLSLRNELYSFHMLYDESFQNPGKIGASELFTGKVFSLPGHVNYALINFNDPWFLSAKKKNPAFVQGRIDAFLKNFKPIAAKGSSVLLIRSGVQVSR